MLWPWRVAAVSVCRASLAVKAQYKYLQFTRLHHNTFTSHFSLFLHPASISASAFQFLDLVLERSHDQLVLVSGLFTLGCFLEKESCFAEDSIVDSAAFILTLYEHQTEVTVARSASNAHSRFGCVGVPLISTGYESRNARNNGSSTGYEPKDRERNLKQMLHVSENVVVSFPTHGTFQSSATAKNASWRRPDANTLIFEAGGK